MDDIGAVLCALLAAEAASPVGSWGAIQMQPVFFGGCLRRKFDSAVFDQRFRPRKVIGIGAIPGLMCKRRQPRKFIAGLRRQIV
jgi:hypothetical protein